MDLTYRKILFIGATCGALLWNAEAAKAQEAAFDVKPNLIERTHYYSSPRQFQIIDDSPVVRDFREAPVEAGTIGLPAEPVGDSRALANLKVGAMPASPGSDIPGDGLHLTTIVKLPAKAHKSPPAHGTLLSGTTRITAAPIRTESPVSSLLQSSMKRLLNGEELISGFAKILIVLSMVLAFIFSYTIRNAKSKSYLHS